MVIKKYNQGQTLIEAIVAITIIVIAIIALLILATYSIHAGTESREKVQAALLAQEAIEIVKNNRDTYWLQGKRLSDMKNTDDPNLGLLKTSHLATVGAISGPDPTGVPVSGFTNFKRQTTITDLPSDKKQVTCRVTWTDNQNSHTIIVDDYITDWQKNNTANNP